MVIHTKVKSKDDFNREVGTLSGGQKTRVALCKLLLEKPDIIMLDEPTNHLDLTSIKWLETYLSNYNGAVLIIAHDRYFLDKIVTKVIEIENTHCHVYDGNYSDFSVKKKQLRQAQLNLYLKQQSEIKHQEEVIAKLRSYKQEKFYKRAESREKALANMERIDKPEELKDGMNIKLEPDCISGNDVLTVEGLSKSFDNLHLFSDISFEIKRGEHVALIGDNGTGKTTILKIINDIISADAGTVKLGTNVHIGYYDQEHHNLEDSNTLFEEIADAYPDMTNTKIRNTLAAFMFTGDEVFKLVKDLSGGEKGRLSLAKLMLSEANLIILDEPTNHLDLDAIEWLEEFLINFDNTVIVVSHDRYFLNKVCTQIADIDYAKIQLYAGNYDFWYESSQLIVKQMKEANRKKEEKIKELQDFIQRFSANASKSKQATSRKRALEKIELDEIRPSSRKYPYIDFRPNREIGNEVLTVEHLSKTIDGVKVLDDISFVVGREDKIAFVGSNGLAKTTLFQILAGQMEPDEGSYKWGITTSQSYFPKDNTKDFDSDDAIVDWLTQYSDNKDATYVRQFLGRMLFPGDAGVKKVRVLSGGEKVRVMLSKLMISGANVLIVDEPTDHLDMESITALNNGLIKFPGVLLFSSRDHQVVQTTANRIMEIVNGKLIDKITTYDEYLENDEMARKRAVYTTDGMDADN